MAHIASCDTTDLSESDNYPIVDEIVSAVLDEAEKIGLRELNTKLDLQDDGIPS